MDYGEESADAGVFIKKKKKLVPVKPMEKCTIAVDFETVESPSP